MGCILALDQGTTSSRAIVFDEQTRVLGTAQQELPQVFPQPGWVEHDPREIWHSQLSTAQLALDRAGIKAKDIAAIGITNQRETTLLWDRATGEPVHNAIVWQDRRTAAHCTQLASEGHEPRVRDKTGLLFDPYFSATKLAWLLDHVPKARERAQRGELAFGTVDSWLVWKLTGGRLHVTDLSNASRTLLCDISRGEWDTELLELFCIPPEVLPRIVRSSGIVGHTDARLFGAEIAISGIAGDQQAALFGQACHAPGQTKNTYGTGCFLLMHTGQQRVASHNGLVTTCAAQIGDRLEYALEGSVFVAGAVVQWLRDGLGIIGSSAEVERLATSVPDTGGVYFVPAFTGLGAPYWDAGAQGTIVGLTRGSTRAHIARAALESIAFQSADLVAAMERDAAMNLPDLRVDGGATANGLLMQFQADLLGCDVLRPTIRETTALGAAYLAGLAVNIWKSPQELMQNWQIERRFTPRVGQEQVQDRLREWRAAISTTKAWSYKRGIESN